MGRPGIFSCFRCLADDPDGDDDKNEDVKKKKKGAKEPEPEPSKPQAPPPPPCATTTEAVAIKNMELLDKLLLPPPPPCATKDKEKEKKVDSWIPGLRERSCDQRELKRSNSEITEYDRRSSRSLHGR